MRRKDFIFLCFCVSWLLYLIIMCSFFLDFTRKVGALINMMPILILLIITMPKMVINKYNNWLETDLNQPKPVPTLKQIRLKKLKKIRYENKKWFR